MLKYLHKSLLAAGLFCFLLLVQGRSYAQEKIKSYVQQNAVPVHTIEPDSVNYNDLEALGDAIGEAKVVMLGEQDHGDAPTFLAKTRIIRYLHEKKGFNVLAFESEFFGLNYVWDHTEKNEKNIDSVLKYNVGADWTYCHTCKSFFYSYIPSTFSQSKPLEITGFDPIMSPKYLAPHLDSLLRNLKLPITLTPEYATEVRPCLENWAKNLKDSVLNNKYLGYLAEIKEELRQRLPENDFWLQLMNNLVSEDLQYQHLNIVTDHWKMLNIRDRRMALNLTWLNEFKYAKEKIIVWAHNYHVSKYSGHYPEEWMAGSETMGTVFTSDPAVMNNTYILGFTSYEGTAGRMFMNNKYKVDAPMKNSFENWIGAGSDFAFVDFKKFNRSEPDWKEDFYMSGATLNNRYHTNSKAQWNRIFDGVFFIRKMYPCVETK
jgi:erythromycin esterase